MFSLTFKSLIKQFAGISISVLVFMPKHVFRGVIVYTTETKQEVVSLFHDTEIFLHPQSHM